MACFLPGFFLFSPHCPASLRQRRVPGSEGPGRGLCRSSSGLLALPWRTRDGRRRTIPGWCALQIVSWDPIWTVIPPRPILKGRSPERTDLLAGVQASSRWMGDRRRRWLGWGSQEVIRSPEPQKTNWHRTLRNSYDTERRPKGKWVEGDPGLSKESTTLTMETLWVRKDGVGQRPGMLLVENDTLKGEIEHF